MLAEALRLIRVYNKLKQYQVAEALGVSKSHISEIEKGTKTPSFALIEKYSEEFKIPVSSIVFFAEQIPNVKHGDRVHKAIATRVIKLLKFIEERSEGNVAQ